MRVDIGRFRTVSRLLLLALFVLFSTAAFAEPNGHIIGGVYYDNLNHLNARVGYSYYLDHTESDALHVDSPIVFGELELGAEGQKLTLGYGFAEYAGGMGASLRFGVSAAEINDEAYLGVETVLSVLVVAFKLGAYRNMDSEENAFSLGMGLGF